MQKISQPRGPSGSAFSQSGVRATARPTSCCLQAGLALLATTRDPHQTLECVTVNGTLRELAMGDPYVRGSSTNDPVDLIEVRSQIRSAIESLPLSAQPHWIKIVYGQTNGTPMTVAATLDNGDQRALTELVKGFAWPKRDEFYMAKQFIVVR